MDPDIVGDAVAWGVDFAHDAGGLVVWSEGLTLLSFFKAVAGEEEVARADGVVDAACELADVVIDEVKSVVVVAVGAGNGTGRHRAGVEEGSDVAVVERGAVVANGGRRIEGAVVAARDVGAEVIGECGCAEVAGTHGLGGNKRVDDGAAGAAVGVDVALRVVLGAGEEGEILDVRNGAADGAARIDEAVVGTGDVVVVCQPVVGVELVGASIGEQRAVIARGARFGDASYDDRTIGLVGSEVGGLDLHFADEGDVYVLEVRAEVAGVGEVGAVELDGDASDGSAVRRVRCGLTYLDLGEVGSGVRGSETADGESGQRALQFVGVAAGDGEAV